MMNSDDNQIAVVGEALIDLIANENGAFVPHVGGSPFNFARAIAQLGYSCIYLSPISTDAMGRRIAEMAQQSAVMVPANNVSAKATSLALVYTDENGLPDYNLYRNQVADTDIDSTALLSKIPEHLSVFHTGSLALVPTMEPALLALFSEVKSRGAKISIDVNIRLKGHDCVNNYLSTVKTLMPYADFLKISDEDLEHLYGTVEPSEFCKTFIEQHNTSVIAFTRGADGAELLTNNNKVQVPPVLPGDYVDTVGAGDTFFAALISRLIEMDISDNVSSLNTGDLEKLGRYASIAAGLNVCRQGCKPATANEISAVAKQHNLSI